MSFRILQILNRVPFPLKDGGSIGYYNYTKGYHDAGCEVTVAALNTSKHYVKKLPKELTDIATWHTFDINTNINTVAALRNLLFSKASYNIERFYNKQFSQQLINLVSENKFDVVIFESLFVAQYIKDIYPHCKSLLVLREHNIEYEIWQKLAGKEKNPLKQKYFSVLAKRLFEFEKNVLNEFDVLTTVTKEDAQHLKNLSCIKPIFASPVGVEAEAKVEAKIEKGVIGFLGSLEWLPNQEGVEWFAENVWQLIKNNAAIKRCEIAGRNMPAGFRRFNDEKLKMIGEVDNARQFIENKQLMIVPLLSGSGIRVKILEAMALGKTIVCTQLARQGIEAENGVHLLQADSPRAFADAILKCLNDENLCKQIGENARKLVEEKYDNKKIIDNIIQFYKQQTQ